MLIFVVDLDVAHTLELFHRLGQRLNNVVPSAVGAADTRQIDVQRASAELDLAVAYKTVPHGDQSMPLFFCVRAFEVFIKGCRHGVGRAGDLTRNRIIEGRNALIHLLRVGEEDVDRYGQRRPRGGGR